MSGRRTDRCGVYYHSAEHMREVDNGAATLVIASPPFTNRLDCVTLDKQEYLDFIRRVFREVLRMLRSGGILVVINTDLRDHARYNRASRAFDGLVWHKHSDIRVIADELGFRCVDTKIWAKSLKRNSYRYTFAYIQFFEKPRDPLQWMVRKTKDPAFAADVWLLEGGTTRRNPCGNLFRDAIHPEIVRRCLTQFTSPGDLVVSPFTGSGTILSVATSMGRRSIGYEVNRKLRPLISDSIEAPQKFYAYRRLLEPLRD
jgi:DNA modification methylase